MPLHRFPIRHGTRIRDEIRFSSLNLSYLPFIDRRFSLEIFKRDRLIRGDAGETTVQGGQRLFIQRETVRISGIAKIF
jgi:hypothetical protein